MGSYNKGFTILELVVALAVLTIVSTGVMISVYSRNYRTLTNASLLLQADLRYAQRRAMAEGRRHGIVFDRVQNRYHIVVDHPRDTIRTVYLPQGVTLLDTTGPQLMFLPRGTASSGFRITLESGRYVQDLTATVSGGRIHIFDPIRQ